MKRIFTFFLVLTMVFGSAYNATAEQGNTDPWARIKELQNEALSSLETNRKADEENMANIDKIEYGGTDYELKDNEAREAIRQLTEENAPVRNAFGTEIIKSKNLLNPDQIEEGVYYWIDGAHASEAYNSTPMIEVEEGMNLWYQCGAKTAQEGRVSYKFRFLTAYDSNKNVIREASVSEAVSYVVPSGVKYIVASIVSTVFYSAYHPMILNSTDGAICDYEEYGQKAGKMLLKQDYYDADYLDALIRQNIANYVTNGYQFAFAINSDSFYSGLQVQDMYDYSMLFVGNVDTFGGISLCHGYNEYMGGHINVTSGLVEYYMGQETTPRLSESHGLTIKDYIAVRVDAKPDAKADITIFTNGGHYSKTDQVWDVRKGELTVRAIETTVINDCKLSYTCKGWQTKTHLYGDSYFGVYSDKWTQHMVNTGLNNYNLNAYPGRTSEGAYNVIGSVLANSNPERIVWCLGMNDGDENGQINASWLSCIEKLKEICRNRGIELILATIPNVPTVDNTHKNAYVRESGYRYIDFAAAVGAQNDATWYDGMLSSDGVHPSEQGAIALFNRAIADVPELMF